MSISRFFLFWGLIGLTGASLSAQSRLLQGEVRSARSGEAVPFANLVSEANPRNGTTADLTGEFRLRVAPPTAYLRVTCLGYAPLRLRLDSLPEGPLTILLQPRDLTVAAVSIETRYNPALRLMRLAIANRKRHHPEKQGPFSYQIYNKFVFDYALPAGTDSLSEKQQRIQQLNESQHILLMESVAERQFLDPRHDQQTVIATRVSGFKNPTFMALATQFQPFSFYDPVIPLLDREFVNPISPGSLARYDFRLQETLFRGEDTVFVISFAPKSNSRFEGLKGQLYLHSFGYAVQNVVAEPAEPGLVHIRIEQVYTLIDQAQWFPQALRVELLLKEYPSPDFGLRMSGRSTLRDIQLGEKLEKKEFSIRALKIDPAATQRDSSFWAELRPEPLDQRDRTTYQVVDSIGQRFRFDVALRQAEKLVDNRLGLGAFDLMVDELYRYNEYEGHRLGLGLRTNERLLSWLSLGAYGAYGFRDQSWKYGGDLRLRVWPEREGILTFDYQQDLREPGQSRLDEAAGLINLRNYFARRMDSLQRYGVRFRLRPARYWETELRFDHEEFTPTYGYAFRQDAAADFSGSYRFSSVQLGVRFAYGEELMQSLGQNVVVPTSWPVLSLRYTAGLPGWLGGDFAFHRLELQAEQEVTTAWLGRSHWQLRAGWVSPETPLMQLFHGSASHPGPSDLWLMVPMTFQTMRLYEFVSDRYVQLLWEQNLGPVLWQSRWSRPEPVLSQGVAFGDLREPALHQGIEFRDLRHGYYESGLQLQHLLRMQYRNILYLGLGAGVFYRYGPYQWPQIEDNLALKLTLSFSSG